MCKKGDVSTYRQNTNTHLRFFSFGISHFLVVLLAYPQAINFTLINISQRTHLEFKRLYKAVQIISVQFSSSLLTFGGLILSSQTTELSQARISESTDLLCLYPTSRRYSSKYHERNRIRHTIL